MLIFYYKYFTCLHLHLHLFHEFFVKFQPEAITIEIMSRFGTNLGGGVEERNGSETDKERRAGRERLSGEEEATNNNFEPVVVGWLR